MRTIKKGDHETARPHSSCFMVACFSFFFPSHHTRGLTEDMSWIFLWFTALSIEDIFWWESLDVEPSWSRRRAELWRACFLGSNINTTRSPSFKEASQLCPTILIATPHDVYVRQSHTFLQHSCNITLVLATACLLLLLLWRRRYYYNSFSISLVVCVG